MSKLPNKPIVSDQVSFQSEGRLLQELGERLVSKPEIALVELIKNAFDADSSTCRVAYNDTSDTISITDCGFGMTEDEFVGRWMRIASSGKRIQRHSKNFKRQVTGEKGIGRFAVRFLGKTLQLVTVAYDETRKHSTRLEAFFDWELVDKAADLGKVRIPYKLWRVTDEIGTGTTLSIGKLRISANDIKGDEIRSNVLKIVSPFSGLERKRFRALDEAKGDDPGFKVYLPGDAGDDIEQQNLSEFVLRNFAGRATISLNGKDLLITASVANWPKGTRTIVRHNFSHAIKGGFEADIRFFPRRPGLFRGKGINGRTAWGWLKENAGVAIIDHGLRIRPYGDDDDDWLSQDRDSASNYRKWRSSFMIEDYGQPDSEASTNPMLYLPQKRQLVGAIFLESTAAGSTGLVTSADREGYLDNEAFRTLSDIVRASIELLALVDKTNQERLAKIEADRIAKEAQASFKAAISRIQSSQTLAPEDKARIVTEYSRLSDNLAEAKDYARRTAFNLEAMSLLGVVAGFMTHESRRIVRLLDNAVKSLSIAVRKGLPFEKGLQELTDSRDEFKRHLDYTSAFIDSVNGGLPEATFKVKPQIAAVLEKFSHFAISRNIDVTIVADEDCRSPRLPVAIYTGVILNLYTNALKAIIARQQGDSHGKVEVHAWNDRQRHFVEVLDNGVGIPADIRDRIWDPLFTTTSSSYNPLGSGMGLGLSLVKRLVDGLGGKIELTKPPAGYSTCFEVQFKITT